MSILLMGRWDHGGNLVIEESYEVEDGDQESIDGFVDDQDDDDSMAWACEFETDSHSSAVQMAYEEYVADEGSRLIDDVYGFEPAA
jgi:meiotically up-regulated gene 157 (Mug157) protein